MIQIHSCEQGSPEWFAIRAGMPTASEFETIIKTRKDGKPSDMRRTYLLQLAGEVLTGEPPEGFYSLYTERGKLLEPEARDLYAMLSDTDPQQVGFITNGPKGCSPDSLVGTDGMLEIKTKKPAFLIDAIMKDAFLEDHKAQCQGALWVAEREWIDLCVYWPGLPPIIKRAYRDEEYIAALSVAVEAFNAELAEIVAAVRAYGHSEALAA
jgi:hypothetical protein